VNRRTRRGGQSWTLSILLHLGLVAAAFGVWYWTTHRRPAIQSMGIEAHVVTSDALARPQPLPPPEPEPVPEPEPDPEPETQIEPPDPGPTQEQIAAQEAETARVAEEKRLAAEREVAERKAAAEKAERERKDREAREKAAKEKAQKEKAERERLAREKAERDKAAAALKQREDELSRQLAEEERQAKLRNSDLMSRYIGQIAKKIERNWKRPPNAIAGISCQVHVTQTPGGTVTNVDVTRCNGDAAVRQSIEDAVYRASPLPDPPDPALFERDLVVTFRPD
jgi:colicin import membrane protein